MAFKVISALPGHLVNANPQLIAFIKRYYDYMEEIDGPSYAIEQLLYLRDIDAISNEFIDYLRQEIAQYIPKNLKADKRKLYKHIVDLYKSRGSIPSFVSGFNLLFNEQIELYYPHVDILKTSDGKWDIATQKWLTNDGFLSDTKYIQDSFYYQSFSYVIKTGQKTNIWRDYVKKILHPAGFRFFGEILIQSSAKVTMNMVPHNTGTVDTAGYVITTDITKIPLSCITLDVIKEISTINTIKAGPTLKHFDQTESKNESQIYNYYDIIVKDAIIGEDTNFVFPTMVEAPDNTNPS